MDKTLQELIKSCRPYVSKRTKFLHWDGPYEKRHDTIPVYENFCYAIGLMRLKDREAYQEGKELYDHLMAFQKEGKFPYALHEFPRCPRTLDLALKEFDPTPFTPHWAPFRHFLRDGMVAKQEGFEPKKSPLDQTLAYLHNLPPTKLSPEYLHLALIEQKDLQPPPVDPKPIWIKTTASHTLFWKKETLDSLALFTIGEVEKSDNIFSIHYPGALVQDEKETTLYINKNIHPVFYSEGKRVTAFKLDSPLEIKTDSLDLRIDFEHTTKDQLYGHIALANRPGQLLQDEVYDYAISLRTIRREGPIRLKLKIETIPEIGNSPGP